MHDGPALSPVSLDSLPWEGPLVCSGWHWHLYLPLMPKFALASETDGH